ncbi:MAG TPA: hypothetical protein DDX98_02390 [Bacteroidales bacterium]|jgi:hypothetical protein|nr:hypothetical protein [Bacteroidales bacterium]
MKPTIIIKLRQSLPFENLPFRQDFIRDKSTVKNNPGGDQNIAFNNDNLYSLITREFDNSEIQKTADDVKINECNRTPV